MLKSTLLKHKQYHSAFQIQLKKDSASSNHFTVKPIQKLKIWAVELI